MNANALAGFDLLMFHLGAPALSLLFCHPLTSFFLHPCPPCPILPYGPNSVCAATGTMSNLWALCTGYPVIKALGSEESLSG